MAAQRPVFYENMGAEGQFTLPGAQSQSENVPYKLDTQKASFIPKLLVLFTSIYQAELTSIVCRNTKNC